MKRKKPLQRKTPLKRSTKPLKRTPIKKDPTYRIPKITKKTSARNRRYSKERAEFLTENPECQIKVPPKYTKGVNICKGLATDLHHGEGRGDDVFFDKSTWRAGCRPCHDWAELHPKEAKEINASSSRLNKKQ